jgi:hypothetical protein
MASANPEAGTARLMYSRQKCAASFGSAIAGWGVIGWGMGAHAVMLRPMMNEVFFISELS